MNRRWRGSAGRRVAENVKYETARDVTREMDAAFATKGDVDQCFPATIAVSAMHMRTSMDSPLDTFICPSTWLDPLVITRDQCVHRRARGLCNCSTLECTYIRRIRHYTRLDALRRDYHVPYIARARANRSEQRLYFASSAV